MPTAPHKDATVVIVKPSRQDDPRHPVRSDFEPDDIQPVVEELTVECEKFRRKSLRYRYTLGKIVQRHYDRVQEERSAMGRSMYGQRFFRRLGMELKHPEIDGGFLSQCYRLVRNISEDECRDLCRHGEITPTHVDMLALIDDREIRDQLKDKIIDEKLTTKQLFEVKKKMFGVQNPNAGRKVKKPKDVDAALTHLKGQAEKFCSFNSGWFGDVFDLPCEIQDLPGYKVTDKLKAQIAEAAEQCDALAAAATEDAKALRGTLPDIDRRIQAQAKHNARIEAAEKDFHENEAAA